MSKSVHDGREAKDESQHRERLFEPQIRKLIDTFNLTRVSRRAWLTTALALLGATSAVAIWQLHWEAKGHASWTFLSSAWWLQPFESNPEAALPRFNRRLEAVAVQPGDNRVWLAGEAGFIAVADSEGRGWTEVKYDYSASTGELRKSASPEQPTGGASPKLGGLHFPNFVPSVFAGEAPRRVTASTQQLTFSTADERQTVTITNESRVRASVNSISVDARGVFTVESACKVIEPGQGCAVTVRFGALSPGAYTGRLVVSLTLAEGSITRPTSLYVNLNASIRSNSDAVGNATRQSGTQQSKAAEPNGNQNTGTGDAAAKPASNSKSGPEQSKAAEPNANPGTSPAVETKPAGRPSAAAGSGSPPGRANAPGSKNPPAVAGTKPPAVNHPTNAEKGPATQGSLAAVAWKPPAALGTILALEWESSTSGRMVTEDAVIYNTTDSGDTWDAKLWDTTGYAAKTRLSVGEKDLELVKEAGRTHATAVSTRIPPPTRTSRAAKSIIAIAKNPSNNSVWIITRSDGETEPSLRRSADGIDFWNASRRSDEGVYWRLPAPWYWFLALPLVLLAAAAAAFSGDEAQKVQESVSNIGIPDRPLKPGEPDAMNLNALAQGLSLFLRNESTKPPLVLAVNGDWGTGKSSLMNLLQQDLKRRGARAVWFNAWHHQKEQQLLAALLQTVRKDAVPPWWTGLGLWLRAKLLVKRGRKIWWAFAVLFAAAAFLVRLTLDIQTSHVGLLWNYANLWLDAYKGYVKEGVIPGWLTHAPLYTSILGVLYALNGVRKSATAFGANPASLLASFSGLGRIKDLEAQTSFRQQFSQEFRQVVEVLGSHRLLIVIDDLDRCRPEKVREVLETVNFLVSSADCFVILGLARGIVEHCVGLSFSTIVDTMPAEMLGLPADPELKAEKKREVFARRYLDKLVQMEVSLPQLTEEQARTLLGAEPAAFLTDEHRRKMAEAKRRRNKIEGRLRAGFEWTGRWVVPAAVCLSLSFGLWRVAHPLAGPVAARIERQLIAQDANQKPAATAIAVPTASPLTAAPAPVSAVAASAQAVGDNGSARPNTAPGVQSGSSPQPEGWIQSWPALLVLVWVLWFFFTTIKRRVDLVSKDSPQFRAALDIWSPLVMSVMNTPRAAIRFLNRVRYLAMRQRALSEQDKPSILDRLCSHFGAWLTFGPASDETHAPGFAPTTARVSIGPEPRSLGAAATTPMTPVTLPNIPESLLVALAAIQQVPGGWEGLAGENWEGLVKGDSLVLMKGAVERHKLELRDWDKIQSHVRAYQLLCSDVVAN